jgi:hypothetical protein
MLDEENASVLVGQAMARYLHFLPVHSHDTIQPRQVFQAPIIGVRVFLHKGRHFSTQPGLRVGRIGEEPECP